MLQIHIAKDVDYGNEGAVGVLLELGHLVPMEDVPRRYEPEEHAHPVEPDDEEDPVAVHCRVDGERHDPGGDGAQPPEELEDDAQPSEDELVDVLPANVLVEGSQSPADAHQ